MSGVTLVEALVAGSLMVLVLITVWQVAEEGTRYIHYSESTIDAQQAALNSILALTQELGEGSADSFKYYPAPNAGVVFASARDASGKFQYDPTSTNGGPVWQKIICYYLAVVNQKSCLLRVEEPLAAPSPTAQKPWLMGPARTTSYFLPWTGYRMIGRNLSSLEVTNTYPMAVKCTATVEEYGHKFEVQVQSKVAMKN